MTEKELKKLNRLELLELLLSEIRDNERLRIENERLRNDATANETALGSLSEITEISKQLTYALGVAQKLSSYASENYARGKAAPSVKQDYPSATAEKEADKGLMKRVQSDRELYWRIMGYYNSHSEAMDPLPDDIRSDAELRLKGINDAKQQ